MAPPSLSNMRRRAASIKRGVGPFGFVECPPVADYPSVVEAVCDFFEIGRLLFEGPPEVFGEDVVDAPAPAIH